MTIKLVLAEDDFLLREGVRGLLDSEPDFEIAATCGDLPSLLAAVEEHAPDVVLTDIRMPPTSTDEGIQAATLLRSSHPSTGVVVLSAYDEPDYALSLLEGGSQGRAYLLKQRLADLDQLVAAIREVARGGSVIDPKVVEGLVSSRSRSPSSPIEQLTARERDVLAEMAVGRNNAAISTSLSLTERAVERHINSIFSKLGLSSDKDMNRRVKAVLVFLADTGG